ncbi:MAG: GNAT family N-acetyltransferase [Dietzia sp.]|nr:GNAT family N-acetyltransferase [Demequina sp.]MBC7306914.1 GNAT family N-acetyltransferase [Dietzia sp.]
MSQTVRIVEPTDTGRLQEIGELTALAYLADGLVDSAHPYMPRLRDAAARAADAVLLAMIDGERGEGKIVGTLTLVPPGSPFAEVANEDEYELRMLAVSPLERGRGIGKQLTQAALDMAVERGAKRVVLSTMETMRAAHGLYEKMGFERRPELDWVVTDNADGSVSKVDPATSPSNERDSVRLLGYSWEPGR